MSDAEALLAAALDTSGFVVIRGFGTGTNKGKQPRQKFFAPGDFKGAADYAIQLSQQDYDAYFATSTFRTRENAEAGNVESVRCLKIDLDIDPNDEKKYPSKSEAAKALQAWCNESGFPVPNAVVDSGYGVHAYWCLLQAMDSNDGKIYSEKFKQILMANGLKLDRTVTGDVVRVLRVPDTLNYKRVPARKVKLKGGMVGALHDVDYVCDQIDLLYAVADIKQTTAAVPDFGLGAIPAHLKGIKLDSETESLLRAKPKSAKVLIKKSIDGSGCAQIKNLFEDQAGQDEPRWRAGLSVVRFCEDGDAAIHNMSHRHPAYSHAETEKKAALLLGPYKCGTFEANWPALCNGCVHKGKITSPIQLGDFVPLADPKKDNVVVAENKAVDDGPVAYTIPEYPFPYVRGKKGGVYKRNPEDEANPVEVYKFDLYVIDRMRDLNDGFMVSIRMHHPTDGVMDFTVPSSDVGNKEEFRKVLNKFGIMKVDGGVAMVRNYVMSWIDDFERRKAATMVRTQMGWTDNFESFVIGDREITSGGKKYSQTAPSLAPITKALVKVGDPDLWRKTFALYGMPGYEAYAFCALTGFGAPLMKLLDLEGGIINIYAKESGTGKTTVQYAAQSIWGSPKELMITCGADGDTNNVRFHRIGQYQNLPVCIDEATKLRPEDMSNLLLSITQGRAKNRMNGSTNTERANHSSWSTVALTSANTSFVDLLQAERKSSEGELMRIIEIHMPPNIVMSKDQSDVAFRSFFHNYGHAGEAYMFYLLRNLTIPVVQNRLEKIRRELDAQTGAKQSERYWSGMVACLLAGGEFAKEAGLHDFDMAAMRQFAIDLINNMRARHVYAGVKHSAQGDVLGEYINLHQGHTVVMQVNPDGKGGEIVTMLSDRVPNEVHARYERNNNLLYVNMTSFNKYVSGRNLPVVQVIEELKTAGVLKGKDCWKRLTAGTNAPSVKARCYLFEVKSEDLPPLI